MNARGATEVCYKAGALFMYAGFKRYVWVFTNKMDATANTRDEYANIRDCDEVQSEEEGRDPPEKDEEERKGYAGV